MAQSSPFVLVVGKICTKKEKDDGNFVVDCSTLDPCWNNLAYRPDNGMCSLLGESCAIWKITKPAEDPFVEPDQPELVLPDNIEKCSGARCNKYRGIQTKTRKGYTCANWTA